MRNLAKLAMLGSLAVAFSMTGCQTGDNMSYDADARTRPSVDQEMGGGMNRTGSGSDNGSSASGMDRAGGGLSGSHGGNSGAVGAGAPATPDSKALGSGTIGVGAAGAGGAPAPGR
jgi:hypothetical protein